MTNYERMVEHIESFFRKNSIELEVQSNLHDVSLNDADKYNVRYVYEYSENLNIIDMDKIAKFGYKQIKNVEGNPINTADAFVINQDNDWYFIEFKDVEIKAEKASLKDNVIKKAYANWYMLLDVLYSEKNGVLGFDYANPIDFAKNHVYYIVVCSSDKNPKIITQIKNHAYKDENYCTPFMERLYYIFKDAYIYTEEYFLRNFVKKFQY